ncbi:MAG: hypothetical protein EBU90_26040 [Proteobacteria bacterium]|nr:hypothetical protein [Pseudomonadota bacterium]
MFEETFCVEVSGLKIENFQYFLSKFENWSTYKREINLNFILNENKKIEFEVLLENTQSVCYVGFYENPLYSDTVLLQKSSCVLKSLRFKMTEKCIEKLEVGLKILTTEWGKVLKNLIESGNKPQLLQQMKDGQLINFYFLTNKRDT